MSDLTDKPVFCANCGERNPRTNKFCGACGTPIVLPPSAPSVGETLTPAPAAREPAQAPALPSISPQPASPTGSVTMQAPPAPRATVPVPPPSVAIPSDPMARERELERLLTRANVERARALVRDSRATLEQALVLAEHVSPAAAAPVHEQLGDLLAAEERHEEARERYETALRLTDGKRPSAEKKLAEVTVRLSDLAAMERLGGVLAPSDDFVDVLRSPRSGRRHAGVAMLLSLAPGFGQFYCGKMVKAAIILGVFLISFFVVSLMPDRDALFEHLAALFALGRGKLKHDPPGTVTVIFAVIGFLAWLYSIADAPFSAASSETEDHSPLPLNDTPMGKRSDWEP